MNNVQNVILLTASNVFMTFAWFGHLKNSAIPLWKAIIISWGIALFKYILMIPANPIGFENGMTGFQLTMTQEVIILTVFAVFAVFYLKEPFHWRYLLSFGFLLAAVYVMFKK